MKTKIIQFDETRFATNKALIENEVVKVKKAVELFNAIPALKNITDETN